MNRLKRISIAIIAGVCSFLIILSIALLASPWLLDKTSLKETVCSEVSRLIGGEFRYSETNLSLFPSPHAVLVNPQIDIPDTLSASVHRGVLGNLPKTMWVVDYPLLERIYYALVAGFDIYGTAGHQLSTRIYMDALRIEGESYFLDYMPQTGRQEMMASWYIGVDPEDIHYHPAAIPAGIEFTTDEPKRELMEQVINDHISVSGIGFDTNYRPAGQTYPDLPVKYETSEDYIQAFMAVAAPGVSFFSHVADHNANVAWVRVTNIPGRNDEVISIVVDRWHDNVKHLFSESKTLDSSKDRADFIKGFVGSYPNYFYVVTISDLPDFFDILDAYDGSEEYIQRLEKYGINRAEDTFWDHYDWFQAAFNKQEKQDAGIVDLNRYFHLAFDQ